MSAQVATEESCLLDLDGRTLGSRFEIQRRLRLGSFAELFVGRNIAPLAGEPEAVVIKALNIRLQGELAPDLERTLIENVEREARALRQCQHEHLIRLVDCGADLDNSGRQFYYLVLEYLPGGNLARLLQTRKLTLTGTLEFVRQISAALACVHAHGLVHRDVKPANVMLTANHRVTKLIDLGTVRWLDDDSGLMTTVGTDTYAAPEHYSRARLDRSSLTASADVYALGKTTYALLCGEPPTRFKQKQISGLPQSIAGESWAGAVLHVLGKATRDNPDDRYQSAAEFYADLFEAGDVTSSTARNFVSAEPGVKAKKSRFMVDLNPLPVEPAKLIRIFNWLRLRVLAFIAFLPAGVANLRILAFRYNARLRASVNALPRTLIGSVSVVLLLSVLMLSFGPRLLEFGRWMSAIRPARAEQARKPTQDRETLSASTDINIRQQPGRAAPKIGLVERSSIVRLLGRSPSGAWCEIEIVQHGRAKSDPNGSDGGWVACAFLAPLS